MKLETARLIIREYTLDDFDALYEILSDSETMKYYPKPYDEKGVQRWINWCIESYAKNGFGLWALELKETGEFIGDCGISLQNIDGEQLPEIGYHINKKYWRNGYAKEACAAVKNWFFNNTEFDCVYSYMNRENVASYSTAKANGMTRIKEYNNGEEDLLVYAITRNDWKMKTNKVTVQPYNAAWKDAFVDIKSELEAALCGLIIGIEHVGSTSVEGMSAKPCIDIDIVIKDYSVFDEVVERLFKIGYVHEGDLGIKDREAFKYCEKPHLMKHHLYVCPQCSKELHRHTTFRDYLKSNPEAAKEYSRIKEEAAKLFPNDIDKYIEYKSPCIEEIYKQCGLK